MILFGQYTAAEQETALEDAARRLDTEDHTPTVELSVKQIKLMPVLFQPRERLDMRNVDAGHVKSLKRAVKVYGDIAPPTVIRLKGTGFVVVDGHHTLEAYREAKRTTIKCEWFPGTVREAYDQSMLRNSRDKLPVTQADRMQAAWRRVLIGGWTAEQIKAVCGASLRQVGHMRQLIRVAEETSKRGAAFRARLREHVGKGGRVGGIWRGDRRKGHKASRVAQDRQLASGVRNPPECVTGGGHGQRQSGGACEGPDK
jgi:hypothetical protein